MPTRVLKGDLILNQDLSDICWTTPAAFVNLLTRVLGIEFPSQKNEDFVVYGFQTPSEDEKNKLWVATDKANHFVGFYIFVGGKWQRIYDRNAYEVVWFGGDSRSIGTGNGTLAPGFKLIDGTVANINTDVQSALITQYIVDAEASADAGYTVYKYFAAVYVGV